MEPVFILLGSNLGNKFTNLDEARQRIVASGNAIVQQSSIYETEPWGVNDQPAFVNQVLVIETTLLPLELLSVLQKIEHKMGRVREEKYGVRIIDLDILFFGNRIINEVNLAVPHPHIADRRFTLVPLVEINPYWIHPANGHDMKTLLDRCTDQLVVTKL